MNYTAKKTIYRIFSAMMGLIIIIMAFSFSTIKVNAETDYSQFPYGYRKKLKELNELHPNWTFVPFYTGLEWNDVVEAERKGNRSLVYDNVQESWKSRDEGDYNPTTGEYIGKSGKHWIRASKECVEYHLNPINYFDETHIFVFEQLLYNENIHTVESVEAVLTNSWMSHNPLEDQPYSGFNYSNFFIQNAIDTGVSPLHLASRVLQEQGRGSIEFKKNYNALVSGEYGVYNYYNIGAYGSNSAQIIANGVEYAQNQGWTTRALALSGGAAIIGEDWIYNGQDTLYLQKFDVDSSFGGLYYHQYMQNIQAPMSESVSIHKAYSECGKLDSNFVFKIPIYNNMPGNEMSVSEEEVNKFVQRLYTVCLDREYDEGGLEDWREKLINREKSGSQVAYGFIFSKEFKNKNYCNECYVKHLYNAFMGREYDEEGLKYWINELETGKTREYVFNGFVLSKEFGNICEDYGINRGEGISVPSYGTIPTGDCEGCGAKDNVTLFLTRLYSVCLDREPDEEGLTHNCSLLWDHTLTASELARGFILGEEFTSKEYDNATYVDYLYKVLMDREADEEGRAYWISRLDSGATREEVFYGFAKSREFNNLCNKYGIKAAP